MIFFSDMDGTFLTSKKEISDASWRALDAVHEAGMAFVPCTGRAFDGLDPRLLAHPAVRYAICANGASVVDVATGDAIRRVCLGHERAKAIYDLTLGRDVTFDLFADGRCYCRRDIFERLGEFMADPYTLAGMIKSRTPFDESVEERMEHITDLERVAMYWKHEEDRDAIEAAVRRDPSVSLVRSVATNIEVSDINATKGTSLTWLCDHLGIDASEAVAFGDNINDISMIEAAGTGVAMANAEQEAKDAADLLTGTNDEDGVATVIMEKLGRA